MINANHKHFRHSAQSKKDAAVELVRGKRVHPGPAVYLAHVALECALKLRILRKNKAHHTDDLKRLLPGSTFDGLFTGSRGHALHHLARTASVAQFLEAQGKSALLKKREWQRMAGERPYSLRYGIERVTLAEAKSQVRFGEQLTDLILKGTA